ncbi:MAG: stage 0 sporulation protein [Clostridia bacterium]|nr:stage 0 sporulation protein [Clostridia bacterium]
MQVIGVKFKNNPKTYFFDPKTEEYIEGDCVIVETSRGQEFGIVAYGRKEVLDSQLVGELKQVLRKATKSDERQIFKLQSLREEAMKIAGEKVQRHEIALKLVDCEYTFDAKKVILYFTADGRVDFRELVKDLAQALRARIELRQIYERDDIRMRGALAMCGRPCCCSTHLADFEKVSIKMAKIQGLSLAPNKISGICGKLMCCLKYENDYYTETIREMPKLGSTVTTPEGEGVVEQNDLLRKECVCRVMKDDLIVYKKFKLEELIAKERQNPSDINIDDEI